MRVALVCDWFLPRVGGIELHLRDLALAMRTEGIDARIVTTTRGAAEIDGVPVHRVPAALAPSGFAFMPSALAAVGRVIEYEQFDVVHAHASVVSPVAYAGAIAATRAGMPAVLTFHSMLHRSALLLGASETLTGWSSRILLSAVSSVVAGQAVRWMPEASVGVLPNGIDAAFWRVPVAGAAPSADVHFVSAMRLSRKKRPLALVRAFAEAHRFVAGSPNLQLTIAGDGPEREAIARLAAELGVADRVTLTGQLTREALRALYARAHVFVLPSERESFGIAALEARAAGLPVVAMLASGARDFITVGVNGFLARDNAELARFMTRLAVEAPLRTFIAHRNASDPPPHDWRALVAEHRRFYDAATVLRDGRNRASQR